MTIAQATEGFEETVFSRRQVSHWFRKQGGRVRSAYLEKPFLSTERKADRIRFAIDMLAKLANNENTAHLDEKFVYTATRRITYKKLDAEDFEPDGADTFVPRKTINRRHPAKCMFIGVVAKPCENFDGGQNEANRSERNRRIHARSMGQLTCKDCE